MLLFAWIVYFGIWGGTQLLISNNMANNKLVIAIVAIISLVDVAYLVMHDIRGFLLVILATFFAIMGVVKQLTQSIKV